MDLPVTLTLAALMLATALVSGWRGARPPNPHRGPRLVPWRLIMVTSAAVLMMLLVHVANLLGFTTGR